jgi:hypothetical protein
MMTAFCVLAGLLCWICAGIAVTWFVFRHRRRTKADFNHWIAAHPGVPIERVPDSILIPYLFE